MIAGVDEFIFRRGRFSPVIHLTTSTKSHFAKGRQMVVAIIVIAIAGAAQPIRATTQGPLPRSASHDVVHGAGRAFLSPMGEPFVGRGEDGLVLWFEQADSNHDRSLTVDEMTADADRFFQALDVNHDGEIDPDEIARYENVIAPEVRTGRTPTADLQGDGNRQDGRHGGYGGGGRGHGGGRTHRGGGGGGYGGGGPDANDEARAGRYSLLEIPEPVASADADFNRGVSAKEFHKAAADRFRLLDIGHAGRLALPELESIRAAAASASRRAPQKPQGDQAPPEEQAPM